MTNPPEFDIYHDLDRQIEAAAAAQLGDDRTASDSGLGELVMQEIGSAEEESAEEEKRLNGKVPSDAKTLDELKRILENVNSTANDAYQTVDAAYNAQVAHDSEAAKLSLRGKNVDLLATAEGLARGGDLKAAYDVVLGADSSGAEDSMHAALDVYVLAEAEKKAREDMLGDADILIRQWATKQARDNIYIALNAYVLANAERHAREGDFDGAHRIIDAFATHTAKVVMWRSIDTFVLAEAEKQVRAGDLDAAREAIGWATDWAVDTMKRMLGFV